MSRNMTHKIVSIQARECRYEVIHDSREQSAHYKLYTVKLVEERYADSLGASTYSTRWRESRRLVMKAERLTSCLAWVMDDMNRHGWLT